MKTKIMKSSLLIAIVFSFVFLISCNSTKNSSADEAANKENCVEKIDPACSCMMVYEPVCGCNNKTYSNACLAECSGIKEYKKGECDK
jgi:ABC-type cobalt transport system substrate-binding protein